MTIRPLIPTDVKQILDVYNGYILTSTATFEETPLNLETFAARVKRITDSYPFLVAEENGKIAGYAYLDRFNERSAYRKTADLSIYLDPDFKGKGLGRKLLAELENAGEKIGITQIVSLVTEENTVSRAFHLACGFREVGTLTEVGEKFGKKLGVTYFQKSI